MILRWSPFRARVARLASCLALALALPGGGAARSHAAVPAPFTFRTNDVIALVGGEDVVEMQHNGYLELLLTTALPHHQLRFRNLAFEGDTVFEQHRQLNWPSWEKQLERVGATVVMAQFGQAESLQGTNGLGRFVEACSNLLDRFTNGGRRVLLLAPTSFESLPVPDANLTARNQVLTGYAIAAAGLAARRGFVFLATADFSVRLHHPPHTRDGMHLNNAGHWQMARTLAKRLTPGNAWHDATIDPRTGALSTPSSEHLRQLILAKNRLWFDYWRPQNWAFLHGDRTEQASSRDHRDPKKRWFPEEMQKFLPLIEAKEREIWEAAGKLR